MTSVLVKEFLIYVPFQDDTPQRMKLRVRNDIELDDLLFQIERQLVEVGASSVKKPLQSADYVVLLYDTTTNAYIMFENSTFEQLRTCSSILLKRRPDNVVAPVS